ncbi:hypothetical protein H8356DRAFT_1417838 [Neocallimastix lanati (nom. inval.)]|nr:hypothetical protein H8356DRAFT_1417838 [Neocallimastix sp. JGI-2020a]
MAIQLLIKCKVMSYWHTVSASPLSISLHTARRCIPNVLTYISIDHEHQNGIINSSLVGVYASIQSVSNRVKKSFEGKPYEYHVWSHDIPGDMRDDDECGKININNIPNDCSQYLIIYNIVFPVFILMVSTSDLYTKSLWINLTTDLLEFIMDHFLP